MRNYFFTIIMIVMALAVCPRHAMAVPASGDLINVTQPSGETIQIRMFGDEYFHWHEDKNGYIIARDTTDSYWKYTKSTTASAGFEILTTTVSGSANTTGITKQDFPSSSFLRSIKAQKISDLQATTAPQTTSSSASSVTLNNLVILASFSDHWDSGNSTVSTEFGIVDINEYSRLYSTVNYSTAGAVGSVNDYIQEISYKKLAINTIVTKWIKLPKAESFYGSDGTSQVDSQIATMISDAISEAAVSGNSGLTFGTNTINSLSSIDILTVIHSGNDQAYIVNSTDTNSIWSRQGSLSSNTSLNGFNLQRYMTVAALNHGATLPTNIGVICHELGHYLGLPDLYEYDEAGFAVGTWDLMGYGAWGASGNSDTAQVPVHLGAWGKVKLGFITPRVITDSEFSITLPDSSKHAHAHQFSGNATNKEYFLVENRGADSGTFDRNIPTYGGRGALIWHIYENSLSSNANNWTHPIVKLEEADNNDSLGTSGNKMQSGDTWSSGNSLANNFKDSNGSNTVNSMLYHTGSYYQRSDSSVYYTTQVLSNFSASNSSMTYDYQNEIPHLFTTNESYSGNTIYIHPALNATKYQIDQSTDSSLTTWTTLTSVLTTTSYSVDFNTTTPFGAYYRTRSFNGNSWGSFSANLDYSVHIDNAALDFNTGKLTLGFSANIDRTTSTDIDVSKIYLSSSAGLKTLTLDGATVSESSNVITITLTNAQRASSILFSGVQGGDGSASVVDIDGEISRAFNLMPNKTQTGVPVVETADTTTPTLTSSAIDYETGIITLVFSEPLSTTTIDDSKILLNNTTGGTTSLSGSTNTFTNNDTTITITLTETQRLAALAISGVAGGDGSNAILDIQAGAINDLASNQTPQNSNIAITESPDNRAPSVQSYNLDTRNLRLNLTFNENVNTLNSTNFGIAIQDKLNSNGNSYTLPGNEISTSEKTLSIILTTTDSDGIDAIMGFDNPAKSAYLTITAGSMKDFAGNDLVGISTSDALKANLYQPRQRLKLIAPNGSEQWGNDQTIVWQLNGGWIDDDKIDFQITTDEFANQQTISSNINPKLEKLVWDTNPYAESKTYRMRILNTDFVYSTSASFFELDHTKPTVALSYSPALPKAGPVTITATYSEPMASTPTISINQPGSIDVSNQAMTANSNSTIFIYTYDIQTHTGSTYIDGQTTVDISTIKDIATNEAIAETNTTFNIDTIKPVLSNLQFEISFDSIVDEFSTLLLTFSEPVKELNTQQGVFFLSNYSLSGAEADNFTVTSVTGSGAGPYTIILSGRVSRGTLTMTAKNIEDLHSNSLLQPTLVNATWPGPLLLTHDVVLTKGGRTRLMLTGGFLPYTRFINSVFKDIATLDPDGITIHGVNPGAYTIEVTEDKSKTRFINTDITNTHFNEVQGTWRAFRDEFDFQMISFPFNIPNWNGDGFIEVLTTDFGVYGEDYLLYHYDGKDYQAITRQSTEVGPGYGFWMASRTKKTISMNYPGPPDEQVIAVDFHEGWNLIGNPFSEPFSVENIYLTTNESRIVITSSAQSDVDPRLWFTDIDLNGYQLLTEIPPLTSAWIYINNPNGAELFFSKSPEDLTIPPDFENINILPFLGKPKGVSANNEKASSSKREQAGAPIPPPRPGPQLFSNSAGSSGGSGGGSGGGGCFINRKP